MENRLTTARQWCEAKNDLKNELGYSHIWCRLNAIENILGNEYDLARLRTLVQADREGKYAIPPCKLGEKLWCINSYGEVEETGAVGFLIEKDSICIYYKEKMSSEYYNAPLGKVLFLTREAAEEALKGENNG